MHNMLRPLLVLILALLPLALGQGGANPANSSQFPGLNLLPTGSVIRNISLPRYEGHRVSSLLLADSLQIVSPHLVTLRGVRSSLFAITGQVTVIELEQAEYNFETEMLSSDKSVRLTDPRFRADGAAAVFSNPRGQGLVRGPVHTLIHATELRSAPPLPGKQGKPEP